MSALQAYHKLSCATDIYNRLTTLRRLYEYILLPLPCKEGNSPIRLEMIDLQSQLNTSQNLQDRVLDALKNHVFDSITPAKLVQHSGLENSKTGYIKAEELVSYFFRFPTLPKMLDVSGIQNAVIKAIERGLIGYIPSLTFHGNTTPIVDNTTLISFEQVIPAEELDLSGYLLSPWLVALLRTVSSDDADTTKPDVGEFSNGNNSTHTLGYSTNTKSNLVAEDKETVKYGSKTSSVESSVLVDILKGKKPARYYQLKLLANKSQIFQIFELLQILSDKASEMTIQIEVQAHTQQEFDRNWIRNAIEEALDEMDIQASTHLE